MIVGIDVSREDYEELLTTGRVWSAAGAGGISRHPDTETFYYTDAEGMITYEVLGVNADASGEIDMIFDDAEGELTLGVFADEFALAMDLQRMIEKDTRRQPPRLRDEGPRDEQPDEREIYDEPGWASFYEPAGPTETRRTRGGVN